MSRFICSAADWRSLFLPELTAFQLSLKWSYSRGRRLQPTKKKVRDFLGQLMICELTPAIRQQAVQIRREHHLKLPDAIVCATAMEFGVELWTNDTNLAKVPGITCRSVKLTRI
jgi:predicted nucleic acid-binding protein